MILRNSLFSLDFEAGGANSGVIGETDVRTESARLRRQLTEAEMDSEFMSRVTASRVGDILGESAVKIFVSVHVDDIVVG